MDDVSGELEEALDLLRGTLRIAWAPPPFPGEMAEAVDTLVTAAERLHQAGGQLARDIEQLTTSLNTLTGTLDTQVIVGSLKEKMAEGVTTTTASMTDGLAEFDSLFDSLGGAATEQVQDWLKDATGALSDQLEETVQQLGQTAEHAFDKLASSLKTAVENVGNDVTDRVQDRCADAIDSVIDAVVEQALTEVAETLVTTQIGATVTSTIGPYLPAVIALKHSVGAIQDALDAMRMGT
jgi:hypothetical protein